MTNLTLYPIDTLFFRDGTPFTQGASPQSDVAGLFPPWPDTVTGALRAAIARCLGWDERGPWPTELQEVLGSGPDNTGCLRFAGPFLVHQGRPWFLLPGHVIGEADAEGTWQPVALLRPDQPVHCDLGRAVRLPAPAGDAPVAARPGRGIWVSADGLSAVLQGQLPAAGTLRPSSAFWAEERRTGIRRDRQTRTVETGMLFSSRHVRLARDTALGINIQGIPQEVAFPDEGILPLGGESRCAAWSRWAGIDWSSFPQLGKAEEVALVLLTPALWPAPLKPGSLMEDMGLELVSACLDRPVPIGGWSSLDKRPTPMHEYLPSGSVLFAHVRDADRFERWRDTALLPAFGLRTNLGYGACIMGAWPA